jgi:hypothetical protein
MTFVRSIGMLAIAAAVVGATYDSSEAATRKKVYRPKPQYARCVDRPVAFSWGNVLFGGPQGPNGCAPPVYQYGRYVGQDPDPFIRLQLLRDPRTGSAVDFH